MGIMALVVRTENADSSGEDVKKFMGVNSGGFFACFSKLRQKTE